MEKKKGTKAKRTERNVYMAIIIILALYGLRDSEAAVRLIETVFSLLFYGLIFIINTRQK